MPGFVELNYFPCILLSFRLHRPNEHSPQPPTSHGGHDRSPVSHQHLKAPTVPHVNLGLTDERPGLTLPRHHIVDGLAFRVAAVYTQHELWTTQQSTGENMRGCLDGHFHLN